MSSVGGNLKIKNAPKSTFERKNCITKYFNTATSDTSRKHSKQSKNEVIVISSDDDDGEIIIDSNANMIKPHHNKNSKIKPDVIDLTVDVESLKKVKQNIPPAKEVIVLDENKANGDRNIWTVIKNWDSANNNRKLHGIEPNTKILDYKSKDVTPRLKRRQEFFSSNDSKKCKIEILEGQGPFKNTPTKAVSSNVLNRIFTKPEPIEACFNPVTNHGISQSSEKEKEPREEMLTSFDLINKESGDNLNDIKEIERNRLSCSENQTDDNFSDTEIDINDMYNINDNCSENSNCSHSCPSISNELDCLPVFDRIEKYDSRCEARDFTNDSPLNLEKFSNSEKLTSDGNNTNSYNGKYSDFSNNNCNKEEEDLFKSEKYDSLSKLSQDSLEFSQNSSCNPRVILRKLNLVKGDDPITPRRQRLHKHKVEDSEVYLDNTHIFETEPRKTLKPKKIKYTLKHMLHDKIKSDKIKSLEEELMKDLDNGGITRYKEEDRDVMDQESPEDSGELAVIEKTFDKSEDCLGLPTSVPNLSLFSYACLYSQFCLHSLMNSYKLNSLENILHEIRMKNIQLETVECKDNDELVMFLLKLMSCYHDSTIVNSIESILLTLIKSSTPNVIEERSDQYAQLYHQLFINIGLKLNNGRISNNCQICKQKKISHQVISASLAPLIKVFLGVMDNNTLRLSDDIIPQYVVLFSELLTAKSIPHSVIGLSEAILFLLDEVVDWPAVRMVCTKELVEKIDNFRICERICTLLPCKSLRSQQFKRSISQFVLEKIFKKTEADRTILNGIDTVDFEPLQDLSNHLKVQCVEACSALNSTLNRSHFIIFWVCFLMLQHSVGNEKVLPNNRKFLEQIIEDVWASYRVVRDNGCLYLFEFKNYVRIVHDKLNSQLQELPKPKATATGIFKYLCESKVSTNYVSACQSPEHDDCDVSDDLHLMSIDS